MNLQRLQPYSGDCLEQLQVNHKLRKRQVSEQRLAEDVKLSTFWEASQGLLDMLFSV